MFRLHEICNKVVFPKIVIYCYFSVYCILIATLFKGMVEKWLVQVESIMIQSLKDVTRESLKNYPMVTRPQWILNWPGQIVQCVDSVQWTSEVTNSIFSGALQEQEKLCTEQIEDVVKMVQGELMANNQVTVEALIVIDVHCKYYERLYTRQKYQ